MKTLVMLKLIKITISYGLIYTGDPFIMGVFYNKIHLQNGFAMNMALVADMVLNLQHPLLQNGYVFEPQTHAHLGIEHPSGFPPKTLMQTLQLDAPN